MDVGVADDSQLFTDDRSAQSAVAEWQAAGVDTVRVIARWGVHAPAVNERTKPAGFDAANPDDPRYDWRVLDRAVGAARDGGLQVVLTVTGWGPIWGTEFPVKLNPRHKPDPVEFARFATAVARRYGDEVDRYIVWNEPNIALWLQPQSQCSASGRCTPYAPHLYRRIVRAAEPALRAADPGAKVMLGALAPRGSSGTSANANLRPLSFIRDLGCVDRRYRKVRTGSCRGFAPATGDLFAYHPHGLKLSPSQPDRVRDQAQLPDLGDVTGALDRVQRAGGLRVRGAARFPLYLDEYAYQTAPPDRTLGVSTAQQSAYLQEASYRAWSHPPRARADLVPVARRAAARRRRRLAVRGALRRRHRQARARGVPPAVLGHAGAQPHRSALGPGAAGIRRIDGDDRAPRGLVVAHGRDDDDRRPRRVSPRRADRVDDDVPLPLGGRDERRAVRPSVGFGRWTTRSRSGRPRPTTTRRWATRPRRTTRSPPTTCRPATRRAARPRSRPPSAPTGRRAATPERQPLRVSATSSATALPAARGVTDPTTGRSRSAASSSSARCISAVTAS
jgi:hypothetical protein